METLLNYQYLQHFAQASGGGGMTMLFFWVLILGAIWFFVFAPQRKKQKQHKQMIEELSTGDDVITSSGIFGTITNVKEDRFIVRIAEGTKVEIQKTFIQAKVSSDTAANLSK